MVGALDNALMESMIGLFKTAFIDRQKSGTVRAEVERETTAWIHWFNTIGLHSSIDYLPPVEFEQRYHDTITESTSIGTPGGGPAAVGAALFGVLLAWASWSCSPRPSASTSSSP